MRTGDSGHARINRRLAAILAADIAGYSVLMGVDEARTVSDLKAHQAAVLPMLAEHGGRLIDTAGDGILAEFASVVNAVNCAVAIQETMAARNSTIEQSRRMLLRIGINLGDVIYDEARIYGDGINVAARLESIAEPSGICVSEAVVEAVKGKLSIAFSDKGLQALKNIAHPVRAYSVRLAQSVPSRPTPAPNATQKGSIAVLPLKNNSNDPDQEYFADGITDELITALSNMRTYTVLSRSMTARYKTDLADAQEVGRELHVNYVIGGSVRRAGNRVRVTAQLIDVMTGEELWAKRCEGTLEDIFDLQDQITSSIVGTIEPELVQAEEQRLQRRPPSDLQAYDVLLRGVASMHKLTEEGTKAALGFFNRAIELDPYYGRAYAFASWCYRREAQYRGVGSMTAQDRAMCLNLARKALEVDRRDPFVLSYAAASIAWMSEDLDEAQALNDLAMTMHPNSHRLWNSKASIHCMRGETAEALQAARHAVSISPNEPAIWVSYYVMADAYLQELNYEEATSSAKRAIVHNAKLGPAYFVLAAAAAQLGRKAEAQAALSGALKINPGMTLEKFPDSYPVRRIKNSGSYFEGLRAAGLPDR